MRKSYTIRTPMQARVRQLAAAGGIRETHSHSTGMFERGKRETLLADGSIRVETWSIERQAA